MVLGVVHLPQQQLTIMRAAVLAARRRGLTVPLDRQEGPGAQLNSAFTSTAATVGVGVHCLGATGPFQIGQCRWVIKRTNYMLFCSREHPCSSGVT